MGNFIINFIGQMITTILGYFVILMIILFDSIIFAFIPLIVNNYILVRLYSVPSIQFYDAVGMLLIVKVVFIMFHTTNNNNVPSNNDEN